VARACGEWCSFGRLWSKGDGPKAVGVIACTRDDEFAIFVKLDVVFCKKGDAIVVAELADGDEGAGFEIVKDVSDFGLLG
jgi:hypothetical protein